jgi:transposase
MAKYKRYDYCQSVLLPVSLGEQLVPGTLEFAIHTLVDRRMDMSVFDDNYQNDDTGRSAYDPKILLKVVLLGYSRGLTSSRDIERACCENVLFMAISCNQRPDHSTIAAFVSSMKDQIKPLFSDILLVCDQEGLLGGTFFDIDGCKLTALVEDHIDIDKEERAVKQKMSARREKQIKRLEQQAAKIEKWLSKNDKKIGVNKKELHSNVADNDSAKMHTSHGTVQGYNAQAIVD